ncbi:hypothetical protein RN001_000560 [Aquatica leii]|uniref:Flavin-containing monooxygenase n=1 Tax=Aquatica leii TaxID=1421715 RepID=A0AAN7PF32_9COLE|nr:hypothetical protein RN001_000560 [Aquatica leii]
MRLAVIGAGPAGLVAAKYCLQRGYECEVFEQTGNIGGTWVYTDLVGLDEDGIYIHTSMYKDLTTNFPKELMTYVDFTYPQDKIKSYISQEEVLDYLHAYANKFNVKSVVQFYKRVVDILPKPDNKWDITVEDVKTGSKDTKQFDAVFVCNGRFFDPITPDIPGQQLFQGPQSHSRDFRTAEPFKNQRVLIIGGSYSGQELTLRIAEVAELVLLSHRKPIIIEHPKNFVSKPEVKEIKQNGAVFIDGTEETFDVILYCTGFKYTCRFLNKECGLVVEDNWVRPLYKQIINVEYPTMYFIGMPYVACGIPMFDSQVQFAFAAFEKKFKLPTKEDMLKELEQYMQKRREKGIPDREAHLLGTPDAQKKYFEELSDTAGLPPTPPVISKLYARIKTCTKLKCCFKIVDNENFVVVQ